MMGDSKGGSRRTSGRRWQSSDWSEKQLPGGGVPQKRWAVGFTGSLAFHVLKADVSLFIIVFFKPFLQPEYFIHF